MILILFFIFLFTNILNGGLFLAASFKDLDQSFFLNVTFMWFLLNHNKIDRGILMQSFFLFAVGYLVLVLYYYAGLHQTLSNGRVYIGGALPNALGLSGAVAICSLLALKERFNWSRLRMTVFTITGILGVLSLLLATGSRSALLAAMSVFAIYFYQSNKSTRMLFGIISLFFVFLFFDSFSVITDRSISAFENQELGGRLAAWLLIIDILRENYLFGVGRAGYDFIANSQLGYSPSPHNVFLEVFVYGGILGLILWFYLFYKLWVHSYECLIYAGLRLPMMLFPLLLMVALSGQVFNNTLMFFLFAMIFSLSTARLGQSSRLVG